MSDTTDLEKLRILTMWECGKSTAEIAKAVNKSARTVQRWLAHQKREGNMDKKPRGLRPRKTTPEQDAKIYKLVRENPELTHKEILTICNVDIYKGTLMRRIQEAKGIYKIDLFPKKKGPKPKGPYPKKKKLLTAISKADEVLGAVGPEIECKDPECQKVSILTAPSPNAFGPTTTSINHNDSVTTETLLETLMSPELNEVHSGGMKCLVYEEEQGFNDEDHFEDTYEVSVSESDEHLFGMVDTVKGTFAAAKVAEGEYTFATPEENVKVEILEHTTPNVLDDKDSDNFVLADNDLNLCSVQESPAAPKRRRSRKVEHQIISELVDDDDVDVAVEAGETEVEIAELEQAKLATGRKRRAKREPNYAEDQLEGDYDVERDKGQKRGRKRKRLEDKVGTKKEKRARIAKEKIQWEKNRKDTTDIEKKKILIMAECGMTTEDIAKALKKSRRTVQRWLSKHHKGLDMEKKERGRRPRKTTVEEDAKIIQLVKEHPHLSRKEILSMAQINLHKVTLKNRLNEAGMFFNSQGVKILDFTESTQRDTGDDELLQHHDDDEAATTIITCSSLTPTPAITNAILTCPTLSTTLIITNPNENPNMAGIHASHLSGSHTNHVHLQSVVSDSTGTTGCFHDYALY